MAYDDKKDTKFPTRGAPATGTSNERTMLDELGGADGIRYRQRTGADGTVTHVKTRAGHPHFWSETTETPEENVEKIYMDSGIVDLLSIDEYSPVSYLAAPLYYGADQTPYYATKKLLGKIGPPAITTTKPPVSGVAGESFTPVEGGDLVGKKLCAARCPSSVFTGKTRLYAQAQLGAPLKKWGWSLDVPAGQPPQWVHDKTGFALNTNVGIYLDDKNVHWLISLSGGTGVMVTPLKPTSAARLLRPLLSDPAYAADRTKIEAYILAHSSPGAASESVFITVSGLPPAYMLGYGWKFNRKGDKADIISHSVGFPWNYSTHYRLSFTRNTGSGFSGEANRWTINLTTVEGPYEWHNPRFASVIAHPDWYTNQLYIFGETLGTSKADNVPVYCFYNSNDTLELINYTHVGGVEGIAAKREAYPPSWGIVCDWTTDPSIRMNATEYDTYATFFTDGGGSSWKLRTKSPDQFGFSCSAGSTFGKKEFYSFADRTTAGKIVNNMDVVWGGDGWEAMQHSGVADVGVRHVTYPITNITLSDGVVAETSTATYVSDNIPGPPGLYQGAFLCHHQIFGLKYEEGTHEESRPAVVVVPFYDAEAVYIYGEHNSRRVSSGNSGDGAPGLDNAWGSPLRVTYGGTTIAEWTLGRIHDSSFGVPTVNVTTWTDQITTTTSLVMSRLLYSGGNSAFSPPVSMSPFFAGVDYVPQQFNTRSSFLGAVYGFGAKVLKGFPDKLEVSPPPFIGWA